MERSTWEHRGLLSIQALRPNADKDDWEHEEIVEEKAHRLLHGNKARPYVRKRYRTPNSEKILSRLIPFQSPKKQLSPSPRPLDLDHGVILGISGTMKPMSKLRPAPFFPVQGLILAFSKLRNDLRSLCRLSQVCRLWRDLLENQAVFSSLCDELDFSDFPSASILTVCSYLDRVLVLKRFALWGCYALTDPFVPVWEGLAKHARSLESLHLVGDPFFLGLEGFEDESRVQEALHVVRTLSSSLRSLTDLYVCGEGLGSILAVQLLRSLHPDAQLTSLSVIGWRPTHVKLQSSLFGVLACAFRHARTLRTLVLAFSLHPSPRVVPPQLLLSLPPQAQRLALSQQTRLSLTPQTRLALEQGTHTITNLVQSCRRLHTLALAGTWLTSDLVSIIPRSLPLLHHLSLANWFEPSPDLLEKILTDLAVRCVYLSHLNLTGCHNLTDEIITNFSFHHPALQQLILDDCPYISMEGVRNIGSVCADLELLSVQNCFVDVAILPFFVRSNCDVIA